MARCQFHQILAWKWSVICGLGLAAAWTHIFACARAEKTRRSVRFASASIQPASVTKLERRQRKGTTMMPGILAAEPTNTSTVYTLGIKRKIYDSSFTWIVYRLGATLTESLSRTGRSLSLLHHVLGFPG